jgi:hypothetical protein
VLKNEPGSIHLASTAATINSNEQGEERGSRKEKKEMRKIGRKCEEGLMQAGNAEDFRDL